MKALATMLVVAVLAAYSAWGTEWALAAADQPLLRHDKALQLPAAPPSKRFHTAANFDAGPKPIPPHLRPFDAVGRIEDVGRTRTGTGFLIGPCLVLTAYHVLFLPGERPSKRAKFRFALGHGGHAQFAVVAPATPIFWGDFSYSENTPTEDFAVLSIPSCPGRKFSPIRLIPMSLGEIERLGGKLRNAGYPVGHSMGRAWGDESCTVGGMHPLEPRLFAVDCYSSSGMSGGPVFAEKEGQLVAIAIMSRAVVESGLKSADDAANGPGGADLSKYNEALPVTEFFDRVRELGLVDRSSTDP